MIRFGLRFALIALCSGSLLIACAGAPKKTAAPTASTRATSPPQDRGTQAQTRSPYAPAQEDPGKRGNYTRGGLYAPEVQDSAPGDLLDVDAIPEPVVRVEPRSPYGNRSPYVVLGKSYAVLPSSEGYIERGLASFYGNKFHGRRTSNLEVYDMYAFTAAHKTLPLPSFARVTNVANGKSVIVRVNDRGPFHDGRIIDLSYAAAVKLGVQRAGTAMVEVRGLSAGENAREPDDTVADAASVQNGVLPPGVRIATGRPQPAPGANSSTNGGSASVGSPRAGSAIDTLVAALPVASASAGERTSAAPVRAPAAQDWRFDMRQDGKAMTADEFDAWMKTRRARVATGKPGKPDARIVVGSQAPASTLPAVAIVKPASPRSAPSSNTVATASAPGGVTLQVAAFGAHANAERALSMLHGAGIVGARLQDGTSNGQVIWRLRVGPVAAAAVAELAARVAGLGFGQPQVVRE